MSNINDSERMDPTLAIRKPPQHSGSLVACYVDHTINSFALTLLPLTQT